MGPVGSVRHVFDLASTHATWQEDESIQQVLVGTLSVLRRVPCRSVFHDGAEAAGYIEGLLTCVRISEFYANSQKSLGSQSFTDACGNNH